jgi:hypothetical protein
MPDDELVLTKKSFDVVIFSVLKKDTTMEESFSECQLVHAPLLYLVQVIHRRRA